MICKSIPSSSIVPVMPYSRLGLTHLSKAYFTLLRWQCLLLLHECAHRQRASAVEAPVPDLPDCTGITPDRPGITSPCTAPLCTALLSMPASPKSVGTARKLWYYHK